MPYITDRVVHDADSHVMELPHWLDEFATQRVRDAFNDRFGNSSVSNMRDAAGLQTTAEFREHAERDVMVRKNHSALGAFDRDDRSAAVDYIGVSTQLVFPTSPTVWLEQLEHGSDLDLLYGAASATNRAQVDFCSNDSRLLPVGYVPIADLERAPKACAEAIGVGVKALLVSWDCPKNHATSHVALDAVWGQAQEARIPIVFHVGLAERVLPPAHKNNGLPSVPDFHGGEENFRSISYMAIPHGPMQALSMMILDGVLDRFEDLRIGVIELGASWVPGFIRQLNSAGEAFSRHEKRLQALKLRPGEYMARQVRVTPYPAEPAGWIISQSSPEICMFSTDYPHVEGGRNPYGRFVRSTEGCSEDERDRVFRLNFEDLMGNAFASSGA